MRLALMSLLMIPLTLSCDGGTDADVDADADADADADTDIDADAQSNANRALPPILAPHLKGSFEPRIFRFEGLFFGHSLSTTPPSEGSCV